MPACSKGGLWDISMGIRRAGPSWLLRWKQQGPQEGGTAHDQPGGPAPQEPEGDADDQPYQGGGHHSTLDSGPVRHPATVGLRAIFDLDPD